MLNATEARRVYFVQELVRDEKGDFIVCIAIEGETGYYKTDWTWGKDYKIAEQCADEKNAKMGINRKEAMKIVLGTMRAVK